ncbi:MAG: M14 family metallopeptidase [Gammaproteobacteria bacterium]|nr:M14 family metallopeptidase [Gammaproteobacteria bacterium]
MTWPVCCPPICQVAGQPIASRVADDAAVDLIAHRGAPGPTLLAIAAVHGDEYEGPAALAQLAASIDPTLLRGTLLLIPVLNEPACFARARCGPDGQNLARVFPGDPAGSTTAQIAASLSALLARCDALVDLHAAGTFYTLHPWAGYATNVAPAVLAATGDGHRLRVGHGLGHADAAGPVAFGRRGAGRARHLRRDDRQRALPARGCRGGPASGCGR